MSPERRPLRLTFEDVTRFAKELTLEHGGTLPMVIAEGNKGSMIGQMREMPDSHDERLRWMFSSGYGLAQTGKLGILKQVFMISEGWMSMADEEGALTVPPSQDPNRKEVLFVSKLTVEGRHVSIVMFEMLRDEEDQLVELEQLHAWERTGAQVEAPLLTAFVDGFQMGTGGKLN